MMMTQTQIQSMKHITMATAVGGENHTTMDHGFTIDGYLVGQATDAGGIGTDLNINNTDDTTTTNYSFYNYT